MTTEERIKQLEEQQRLTIEIMRNALRGDWQSARIWLDAVDPAHAGTWQETPFPPKD